MANKLTLLTMLGLLVGCGAEPPGTAGDEARGDRSAPDAVVTGAPTGAPVEAPGFETVDTTIAAPAIDVVETRVQDPIIETVETTFEDPIIETIEIGSRDPIIEKLDTTVEAPVIETIPTTDEAPVIEMPDVRAPGPVEMPVTDTADAPLEMPAIETTEPPAEVPAQSPVPEPTSPPAPPASPPPAGQPAAADQPPRLVVDEWNPTDALLEKLERRHADLRDFRADIVYHKWDNVLKQTETRIGEVLYQVRPGGTKRFAVLLEKLIKRNRARDHRKHYVFDGSWLVEIDHEAKIFIKRQVVPPDEQFDPLKLGEGPFPLPIGQPADEVRARFKVRRLLAPTDETLAERLAGRAVDGLRLEPKPGTPEAKEFEEAELFYDRDSSLPVGVSVTEPNGDRKTVILTNLTRDAGVDEAKLNIEEPDARAGWRIDVEPYRTP